ncbi:transposable element Tcb1 transposase [Trichonephila clavipes]|nr:transposable element Tcb1 transposase [Trichonephila clavipes]
MISCEVESSAVWNVCVPSWKYQRNLESPRGSSPGFGNDSKMMVMGVDVSIGRSRVTLPNEARYLAATTKRNRRSTVLDLSRQLSSATDNMLTKYQMIKFIDFCEVWFLLESVARVAAIVGGHRSHTLRH